MKKLFSTLAALVYLSIATLASAADYKAGDMIVKQPWARATLGQMKNGVSFLILENTGSQDDVLIAAEGQVAERIEFHAHKMIDGIMKMRKIAGGIPVKAGTMVELKPGKFHIMMMDLVTPLKKGEMFPLTLTFEKAGKVDVLVHIEKGGAMKAMEHKN